MNGLKRDGGQRCVNRAAEADSGEGILFERRDFHSLFANEDQKQGVAAFVGKGKAVFTGL